MVRQLIAMGMGMGIVPGRQRRFYLRVMGCVRVWMIHGVMMFLLIMTSLVLAWLRFGVKLRATCVFFGFVSW
jgi:hypothetical protein